MLRTSDVRALRLFLPLLGILLAITGCAGLTARDRVHVGVAGIKPLAGRGLELRFELSLRVQNPNDSALEFDGAAVELDVNGRPFATGVSDVKGAVPRFGETVIALPVTVSAFDAAKQVLAILDGESREDLPYVLRGKLAGGAFGTMRFTEKGALKLPAGRPR